MAVLSDNFDLDLASSGPETITYWLTTSILTETYVHGPNRSIASVTIKYGAEPMWTETMTQIQQNVETRSNLTMGNLTIEAGCKFHLTIPSSRQNGNVMMYGTLIMKGQEPQPVGLRIATWPLDSAA